MTLIYIPKPFKDESAASLIIRVTGKNGYRTPSSLLRAYGINIYVTSLNSYFFDSNKFKTLLQTLSIDESHKVLAPSSYGPTRKIKKFYNGIIIYENFLTPDGSRLCCTCIKEKNYLKIDWMIKYLTTCTEHEIKFLENCPQCHSPVNPNRNFINICNNCDYLFSENIQEKTSKLEINANLWLLDILYKNNFDQLKMIKAYFDTINNTKKTFKDIKLSTPRIILGYLYFRNRNEYAKEFVKFLNENSSLAHPRILSIYFIASYQEISFTHEEILNGYTTDKTIIRYSNHNFLLSQRSACIALKTYKPKFKINYFPNLQSADKISSKFIENIIIGIEKPLPEIRELADDYLDVKKLCSILSLNYETSCMLLHRSKIFNLEKISINSTINHATKLKNIEDFQKKYITVTNLAKNLDLPSNNLFKKLCSIGIYPKFGPSIDRTPLDIYLLDDVKHLTSEHVISIRIRKKSFKTSRYYLTKAMHEEIERISWILKISNYNVKKLIKFGILEVDYPAPDQIIRVNDESLKKISSIINNDNYISLREAIKITNSPANWFYRYWVQTGFIDIVDLCLYKLVKKEQVDAVLTIKKEFFTGKEASDFLGMPHSHITNLVTQKLITPTEFGTTNIVKLFRKNEVYQLKEKGYGY